MGIEIERKFLMVDDSWREQVERSQRMVQGYLASNENTAIRVRIAGEKAHINVKSTGDGIHRLEFEYAVPMDDAQEMLDKVALPTVIDKTRHYISAGDLTWEIDEFYGANEGLVVAEIELQSADQEYPRPAWLGEEVSQDKRYFNSSLSSKPFNAW